MLLNHSIFYTQKFSFSSALFTRRFINFLDSQPGFSMIYTQFTFANLRSDIPRVILAILIPLYIYIYLFIYLLWHKLTFIPYLGSLLMHFPTPKAFLLCIFYPFRSSSFIFKSLLKLHSLHFDHNFFLLLNQFIAKAISLTYILFMCRSVANLLNRFHEP